MSTAPAAGTLFSEVAPWLAALAGVVVVGAIAIWLVRRTMGTDTGSGTGGFTLQELRDMHASGQLSDDEFRLARDSLIGRLSEPSDLTSGRDDASA